MAHGTEPIARPSDLAAARPHHGAQHIRQGWLERNERRLFLGPAVFVVLALSLFPLITSLAISFLNWNFSRMQDGFTFVGLHNWLRLFSDPHFHKVLMTTI